MFFMGTYVPVATNKDSFGDVSTNYSFFLTILLQIWWWNNFWTKNDIRFKLHMLIAIYGVYSNIFSFLKYSSGFSIADASKIKKSYYFLWKVIKSFRLMVHTYLSYFSRTNCSITFQEQTIVYYKTLKVTSKCLFVFNKAIFTYIFGWFLMNFTQKLATNVTFRLQFVVQFFAFVFVVSGTNNFIDTLETTFCSLIFNLWMVVYFLDIQNTSHFVEDFDLKVVWIFKSSLNAWEDKSFSKLIPKLKISNLDVVVSEDCFSIGSACVQ